MSSITRAIQSMIFRGAVKRVDDSADVQVIQTSGLGGYVDEAEHVQPYGFRSRAFTGAQTIVSRLGAVGALVSWVFDGRYKIELEEGEVAIFDDQGQKVHLKRSGIEFEAVPGGKVTSKSPVDVTGKCNATTGFQYAGADGVTGLLTITDTTAAGTVGSASIAIAGGIITNITATGTCAWIPT